MTRHASGRLTAKLTTLPVFAAILLTAWLLPAARAEAGCLAQYIRTVNDCANLRNFVDRSVCGIDAALELVGCVRRTVAG